MVDWKTYKGQTPWGIVPVTNKKSYNEGSKIATSEHPVWDYPTQGATPITPTHTPCGYWKVLTPPTSLEFSILMAYINNSPCYEAGSAMQHWELEVVPSTKLYSDGGLSNGYDLPIIESDSFETWCCMFDTLPDGRLVIANGLSIYLETTYQSGVFNVAATIPISSDASFLKVSPDGTKIAFGIGYGSPLIVFDVSLLDPSDPLQLFTADGEGNYTPISGVSLFNVEHYDAVWWDDVHLLINTEAGGWDNSIIGALNVSTGNGLSIITGFPGASGGVCLDNYNNLITGIGKNFSEDVYTGNIYAYPASTIQAIIDGGSSISYSDGTFLCKTLSAGHMIVDQNNCLFVGGGDFVGVGMGSGSASNPNIIGHIEKFQLLYDEEGNVSVGTMEKLYPDSCEDDSAAGPLCKIPKL